MNLNERFPYASKSFLALNPPSGKVPSPKLEQAPRDEPLAPEMKLLKRKWNPWTLEQDQDLLKYANSAEMTLLEMAEKLGRSRASIACRLNHLGPSANRESINPQNTPRYGMTEMKKCPECGIEFESLVKLGKRYCGLACSNKAGTPDFVARNKAKKVLVPDGICPTCGKSFSRQKTKDQKHCSHSCAGLDNDVIKRRVIKQRANPFGIKTAFKFSKKGWRDIGEQRIYARSSWEANYARFLEFQRAQGLIQKWEHEPETFWFDKIKRGRRSYLPDFRVTANDGSIAYHEVKGWINPEAKTKFKRMAKYHPTVVLRIIAGDWFKANAPTLSKIIPNWETYR